MPAGMPFRYRVLSGLFLLSVITYLDRVCIAVASGPMQRELHLGPSQWGWVLGVFTLAYALFEIPTGVMGDRLGGRRILTRIVLWWSAFTALTGAITSYYALLAVRFLFGAGEAGGFPNISAVICRWFPQRERARAIGISWMASRVGGALSPLIVVPLMINFGWRLAFFILGGIGLLWAAGWYVLYRDHPSMVAGISQKERDEIGETPCIAKGHNLPWREVMRTSNFWLILLMYHTYCWGSYFYISWMPTYLQQGRGFTTGEMKYWAMLPFLIGGCGNLFGGWTSDVLAKKIGLKWGRRLVGGGGLLAGGILLLAMAHAQSAVLAAIFLALSYGCQDSMLPVSWAVCLDVGGKYAGGISGSMNMAGQIGSFVSSVAFGYAVSALRQHHFSLVQQFNLPIYPLAGMLLVSGLLFLAIDPTKSIITDETATIQPQLPQVESV
jgi:MFS transporter, ACS family, glucarate transporter